MKTLLVPDRQITPNELETCCPLQSSILADIPSIVSNELKELAEKNDSQDMVLWEEEVLIRNRLQLTQTDEQCHALQNRLADITQQRIQLDTYDGNILA